MKIRKRSRYVFVLSMLTVFFVTGIQFAFNPLGLGPEPTLVLAEDSKRARQSAVRAHTWDAGGDRDGLTRLENS